MKITLSKNNLTLIIQLLEISVLHSNNYQCAVFTNHFFRKCYSQYPYDIKIKSVPLDQSGEIDFNGLRKIIENTKEPSALVLRDRDSNFVYTFFLPQASKENIYVRELSDYR
ncbi:MAG: hypothetical protein ACOYT4_00610 [Nanoarchaeota archaeon]